MPLQPSHRPLTTLAHRWRKLLALSLVLSGTCFSIGACSGAPVSDLSSMQQTVRERFPDVRQLQVYELKALLLPTAPGPKPLLIDVRAETEYAVSHLQGAVHAEGDRVLELARAAEGRPIVLYCSVGYRSSQAAQILMEAGISEVANLEGSIFAWANAGNPVVRDTLEVREVHPYDKKWGQMLERDLWAFEPRPPR